MNYALREYERDIIQAAIRLANSRTPRETQMAVSAFRPLCMDPFYIDELLLPKYQDNCLNHRDNLRDWFKRITESNSQRSKVAEEVNELLWNAVGMELQLAKSKKGVRYIQTQFTLTSFVSALAMATALILDESLGLTNRLKKCGNPKCHKFNLSIKPNGAPRTHCNATCKKAADATTGAERSKRCRELKNKEGGK